MPSADDPQRLAALAALGLDHGASAQEILSAYRRLARASHPDTASPEFPSAEFTRVNAAYRYLTTTHDDHPVTDPSAPEHPGDPTSDRVPGAAEWDAQYRWPDEPQVVAGPVIIRPLPPESR